MVDKARLSIRLTAPYSKARRKAASELIKAKVSLMDDWSKLFAGARES